MFRKKKSAPLESLKNEPLNVNNLIPACRAGRVYEVVCYAQANTDHIYIPVPTEIDVYDSKAGAQRKVVEMNLLTYIFHAADYDVFIELMRALDDTNQKLMEKFHDEMIKACRVVSYDLSFGRLLEHYKAAIDSFKTLKDSERLADIMACLPSYVLQAMCYPSWRYNEHFVEMKQQRKSKQKLCVVKTSNNEKVDINDVIKVKKSGEIVASRLYVDTGHNVCCVVDKGADLNAVQYYGKLDYLYIRLVLLAQTAKIYNKLIELSIYMENNLKVKGSWLKFVALKERGDGSSHFIRTISPLFEELRINEMTNPIYRSTAPLIDNKDKPLDRFERRKLPASTLQLHRLVPVVRQQVQQEVPPVPVVEQVSADVSNRHELYSQPPVQADFEWVGVPSAPFARILDMSPVQNPPQSDPSPRSGFGRK